MRIVEATAYRTERAWRVEVDANEVTVDSGRTVPYPTTIGIVHVSGLLSVWTPAAYVPRGYKAAATRMLEEARDRLIADGLIPRSGG